MSSTSKKLGAAKLCSALALIALLVGASSAQAETFCVNKPGCSGTEKATLSEALDATNVSSAPDTVELGAGTYSNSVTAIQYQIRIVGMGRDQTLITDAAGDALLNFDQGGADGSSIEDLTVRAGSGRMAISMTSGVLRGIRASSENADAAGPPLVRLAGTSSVSHTVIDGSKQDNRYALASMVNPSSSTPADVTITDTSITGAVAGLRCESVANATTMHRTTINGGSQAALFINGASIDAEDVVITNDPTSTTPAIHSDYVALNALNAIIPGCPGASAATDPGTTSVNLRHVTMVNRNSSEPSTTGPSGYPALAAGLSGATGPNQNSDVFITDSIIYGFPITYNTHTTVNGWGHIVTNYVNGRLGGGIAGDGSLFASNLTSTAPQFLDVANGDYRLRPTSESIDVGTPGSLDPGEPDTDVRGEARIVDGKGTGTPRRDLGAFEYQRRAPTLDASASTSEPYLDESVTYTASGSDIDGGAINYEWEFADGSRSTDATVVKRYESEGVKVATVTATSTGGLTTTKTVRIEAHKRPTPPPPPVLTVALKVAKFKVKSKTLRTKGLLPVDVKLNEAAGVKVLASTRIRKLGRKSKSGKRKRGKIVTRSLGSSALVEGKSGTTRVNVKLNRTGKKLLKDLLRRKRKSLMITLTADAKTKSGKSAKSSTKLSIKTAKKKKKKSKK